MLPLSFLYFGKFIVVKIVVRVHLDHLRFGWGSHHLDDLDQVIDAALSDEKRHPVQHLQNDTA